MWKNCGSTERELFRFQLRKTFRGHSKRTITVYKLLNGLAVLRLFSWLKFIYNEGVSKLMYKIYIYVVHIEVLMEYISIRVRQTFWILPCLKVSFIETNGFIFGNYCPYTLFCVFWSPELYWKPFKITFWTKNWWPAKKPAKNTRDSYIYREIYF